MDLRYQADNAYRAELMRRRMKRAGQTPQGHLLWNADEDAICREFGHDYQLLMKKLPHRTYQALRTRCQMLGLRPKRNIMTASELSKMRRIVPTATKAEMLAAFPDRNWTQIQYYRKRFHIYKKRRPYGATGIPFIDAIRSRCFELRLTMGDIDEIAKSKTYFTKAEWLLGRINHKFIARAVEGLGGRFVVQWEDDDHADE